MNSGNRPLRVLAADDSAVMRSVMRNVFQCHAASLNSSLPRMELCGLANNGVEAVAAVKALSPDVLLLDLEMPLLNGIGVLQQLRITAPRLPVIMCSVHTERGARSTLDALAAGAKDYVMKPVSQGNVAAVLQLLMDQLLPRIAALAAAPSTPDTAPRAIAPSSAATPVELVVIGVSTGGPSALEVVLPRLPANFPVPILIVQHMPPLFTTALAERLNGICRMPVRQARDSVVIKPGEIWIAPGDAHMEVGRGIAGTTILKLHQGPPLHSCKPSVDYLFRSAAQTCGSATLALIMTGMGADGFEGAQAISKAGGTVLAQDQATSAVWGMPGLVSRSGLAAATLPLGAIAHELSSRVQSRGSATPFASPEPASLEVNNAMF